MTLWYYLLTRESYIVKADYKLGIGLMVLAGLLNEIRNVKGTRLVSRKEFFGENSILGVYRIS